MEKLVMFILLMFEVCVESIRSMKRAVIAFGRGIKNFVRDFLANWEEILKYWVWLMAVLFGIVFGAVGFAYVLAEIINRMTSDLARLLTTFIPEKAAGGIATFVIVLFIIVVVWIFCFCILHKRAFKIYIDSKGKYSFSKALELEKGNISMTDKSETPDEISEK
jgi:hypothetical protein